MHQHDSSLNSITIANTNHNSIKSASNTQVTEGSDKTSQKYQNTAIYFNMVFNDDVECFYTGQSQTNQHQLHSIKQNFICISCLR